MASPAPTGDRPGFAFQGEVFEPTPDAAVGSPGLSDAANLPAWREGARAPGDLRDVDGVFAAAYPGSDRLVVYADPSNLIPVYWARHASGAPEASFDLTALARSTHQGRRIRPAGLAEFLRLLDVAAPNTFFEGLCAAEPGQALAITKDDQRPLDASPARPIAHTATTFDDGVQALDTLVQRAVRQRLADAGHPAAFLSGGIDSALLCALAARQRPSITAITVGFDGATFDEAPLAAQIARHLGVTHRSLRFSRADYLSAFARLMRGMDQPMADPATMATLLAFEHCREHFDVVLDGTGADEAVGAMPPRHVRLAVEFGSRIPHGLRRALVRAMPHLPGLSGYAPIFDFEHPAETLMRWKGFTRAEIEALCGGPVNLQDTTFYRTFARFPRQAHEARYGALLNAMPCDRLAQAMRLSGLRVRFPFFARDVDGFLRQLPTEWRHLPGQPKRILRALLARYVPVEIWDRPKQGFNFPLHDFLTADDHFLVRRHVLEGRWLGRGLLKPEVVRPYALRYIAGDRQLMFRVWALVVLGAWLDAHEDVEMPLRA